jgi:hypothetical protein
MIILLSSLPRSMYLGRIFLAIFPFTQQESISPGCACGPSGALKITKDLVTLYLIGR